MKRGWFRPFASSPDPTRARLVAELQGAPLVQRIALSILFSLSAYGGLYAGYTMTCAYSNWLTWSIALLVLDPIGVTSLLAAAAILFPRSAAGSMLAAFLVQARLAALLVGVSFAGAIIWAAVLIVRIYRNVP